MIVGRTLRGLHKDGIQPHRRVGVHRQAVGVQARQGQGAAEHADGVQVHEAAIGRREHRVGRAIAAAQARHLARQGRRGHRQSAGVGAHHVIAQQTGRITERGGNRIAAHRTGRRGSGNEAQAQVVPVLRAGERAAQRRVGRPINAARAGGAHGQGGRVHRKSAADEVDGVIRGSQPAQRDRIAAHRAGGDGAVGEAEHAAEGRPAFPVDEAGRRRGKHRVGRPIEAVLVIRRHGQHGLGHGQGPVGIGDGVVGRGLDIRNLDGVGAHRTVGPDRQPGIGVHAGEGEQAAQHASPFARSKPGVDDREGRVGLAVGPALADHLAQQGRVGDGQDAAQQRQVIVPQLAVGVHDRERDSVLSRRGGRAGSRRGRLIKGGGDVVAPDGADDLGGKRRVGRAVGPAGVLPDESQRGLGDGNGQRSTACVAHGIRRGDGGGEEAALRGNARDGAARRIHCQAVGKPPGPVTDGCGCGRDLIAERRIVGSVGTRSARDAGRRVFHGERRAGAGPGGQVPGPVGCRPRRNRDAERAVARNARERDRRSGTAAAHTDRRVGGAPGRVDGDVAGRQRVGIEVRIRVGHGVSDWAAGGVVGRGRADGDGRGRGVHHHARRGWRREGQGGAIAHRIGNGAAVQADGREHRQHPVVPGLHGVAEHQIACAAARNILGVICRPASQGQSNPRRAGHRDDLAEGRRKNQALAGAIKAICRRGDGAPGRAEGNLGRVRKTGDVVGVQNNAAGGEFGNVAPLIAGDVEVPGRVRGHRERPSHRDRAAGAKRGVEGGGGAAQSVTRHRAVDVAHDQEMSIVLKEEPPNLAREATRHGYGGRRPAVGGTAVNVSVIVPDIQVGPAGIVSGHNRIPRIGNRGEASRGRAGGGVVGFDGLLILERDRKGRSSRLERHDIGLAAHGHCAARAETADRHTRTVVFCDRV